MRNKWFFSRPPGAVLSVVFTLNDSPRFVNERGISNWGIFLNINNNLRINSHCCNILLDFLVENRHNNLQKTGIIKRAKGKSWGAL
jgi:hypothetical protein